MCNLWKSYTILCFFQLMVHSQQISMSICKKNFKIDYKIRPFCTFFLNFSPMSIAHPTQLLTRYFRFIKPLQKRFRQKFSAQYLCRKKFMYIYTARHAKSDVMSNITSQQGVGSQGQGPLAVPDPDAAQEIPKTLENLE